MERYIPWFALKHVHGVGNLLYKRLIDRFGAPETVFAASDEDLLSIDGISSRLIQAIRNPVIPDSVRQDLDLVLEKGVRLITLTDSDYPVLLREIPDPPPILYVRGHLKRMFPAVAVVGSRNATEYGVTVTRRLSAELSRQGWIVVSGMARGIDTAAHEGALSGPGGTIAVLGSGLERIYPTENAPLFHRIMENGAVISELPLLTWPDAYHFPRRNRIISGLTLGTVVVEASRNSGSLITARMALEQGREVFAVPGNIHSFKSTGTHILIKSGAKLVEQARDILDELEPQIREAIIVDPPDLPPVDNSSGKPAPTVSLTPEEQSVMALVSVYPIHADELVRKIPMPPGELNRILMQLELKRLLVKLPGNYVREP